MTGQCKQLNNVLAVEDLRLLQPFSWENKCIYWCLVMEEWNEFPLNKNYTHLWTFLTKHLISVESCSTDSNCSTVFIVHKLDDKKTKQN